MARPLAGDVRRIWPTGGCRRWARACGLPEACPRPPPPRWPGILPILSSLFWSAAKSIERSIGSGPRGDVCRRELAGLGPPSALQLPASLDSPMQMAADTISSSLAGFQYPSIHPSVRPSISGRPLVARLSPGPCPAGHFRARRPRWASLAGGSIIRWWPGGGLICVRMRERASRGSGKPEEEFNAKTVCLPICRWPIASHLGE